MSIKCIHFPGFFPNKTTDEFISLLVEGNIKLFKFWENNNIKKTAKQYEELCNKIYFA